MPRETEPRESEQFRVARRFVIDWCSSKTLDEVVRRTGLDSRTCSNEAAALRRRGVPLPHMPRGHQRRHETILTKSDVAELKRLVLS